MKFLDSLIYSSLSQKKNPATNAPPVVLEVVPSL